MSEHEIQALAELDARGRRAATSLKTALAQRTLEAPAAPTEIPAPKASLNGHSRRPPTAHRSGWLAAAAVLVVVVGVVAAFLALRGEPKANVVSGETEEGAYLVPGWLPDRWTIQSASNENTADDPGAVTGEVAVYGDWEGPYLSVTRARGMDASNTDDALQINVRDQIASLESGGDVVVVQWTTEDGVYYSVAGNHLPQDAVIAAAEHVLDAPGGRASDETLAQVNEMDLDSPQAAAEAVAAVELANGGPVVVTAGLPEGFADIARGPLSATSLMISVGLDGLSMVYGLPGSSSEGQLAVVQRPGDADDAELMRLASDEVEVVDVRGHTGYLQPGALLQWFEESTGNVVTLYGAGLDTDALLRAAENLRPANPGEIADLLRQHGQSGPFADDLEEGEVIVTEGENNGDQWRLKASDDGEYWMLTLETPSGGEGIGAGKDGGPTDIEVNQADATIGGDAMVYGTVLDPAVSTVRIEPVNGPVIMLEAFVVDIPGWPTRAFAGVVPAELVEGARVVALDVNGTVVTESSFTLGD